jgi:hypothetical protein
MNCHLVALATARFKPSENFRKGTRARMIQIEKTSENEADREGIEKNPDFTTRDAHDS